MVKKFQSVAVLVVLLSNLALAAKIGLNPFNGLAIVCATLALLLGFMGGKTHE